jgi:Leucine-rich repeat (LRR) protein
MKPISVHCVLVVLALGNPLNVLADEVSPISTLRQAGVGINTRNFGKHNEYIVTLNKQSHLDVINLNTIRKLSDVRVIHLQNVDVSDNHIRLLSDLPRLTTIAFWDCKCEGLGRLNELPSLKHISISNVIGFDDEALGSFAQFRSLCQLSLYDVKITGKGFSSLGKLRELKSVTVGKCRNLTDELASVVLLDRVERLELPNSKVSQHVIRAIPKMKQLKWLDLEGTGTTDAAALRIAESSTIEHLDLTRTNVTEKMIESIRMEYPRLKVMWAK